MPGQRVGRWTLASPLGAGAFGQIWRVTADDGRSAALKLVADAPRSELRAMSRLCHPAVPRLLDHGRRPDSSHYLVMDLASGRPLSEHLAQGALDPALTARIAGCLLDALAAVHQAGVAHGDIKPDNLLLDAMGDVPLSLIDFGLANSNGGTLAWAAPEQLQGLGASPAADVYAAGLVLWTCLQGHRPHADADESEELALRCRGVPAPEHGPAWLRDAVQRMLQSDPALRPTAAQVADELGAHGIPLPQVGPELLQRRAHVAYLPRPGVLRASTAWVERGGCLSLVGPEGSGRTRELERLAIALAEHGRSCLRVPEGSGGEAWEGISLALAELGHGLPSAPDDTSRAHAIAHTIAAEQRPVLVDAFETQDEWTQRVVRILVELEVDLCIASTDALELEHGSTPTTAGLVPLDAAQCGVLVADLLGTAEPVPDLMSWLLPATAGHPAAVGRALVQAAEAGALTRHKRVWVFDQSLAPREIRFDHSAQLPAEGSPARHILELVAVHGDPLDNTAIQRILGISGSTRDTAITALLEARLVVHSAGGVASTAPVRQQLRATLASRRARQLHKLLLKDLLGDASSSPVSLVEHALALGSRPVIRRHGVHAVEHLRQRNPIRAAHLAERLWEADPTEAVATARVRALVAAGRAREARSFGESCIEAHEGTGDTAVMIELASLAATHDGDAELARRWVETVRAALGETPSPTELDLVDAVSSDMLGDSDRALRLAEPLSALPAPEDERGLTLWLRARLVAAQSLHNLGRLAEAIEFLEAVPPTLGKGVGARATMLAALSRLLWFAGRYKDADAALTAAADDDSGLSMLDRARLLNNLGAVRHHSGNRSQAVAAWAAALVLFQRLEASYEQARAQSNLCVGYRELGRWVQARQAGEAALETATQVGLVEVQCHASLNLAELDMVHQDYSMARLRITQALDLARRNGLDRVLLEAQLRALEVRTFQRDRSRELVETARALRTEAEAHEMRLESAICAALLALNLVRSGAAWVEVRDWIDQAIEPLQAAGATTELATVRTWVAEALLEADRPQDAHAQADRVRVFAREAGIVPLRRRAEQLSNMIGARWTNPKQDARVSRLVKLAVEINEQAGLQQVLDRIAEASQTLLEGDRAFVLMGEPPEVVAAASGSGDPSPPSMSVVRQCIEDDREVIAADLDERGDLREQRSIVALELRSVLCVPMRHQDDIIGAIYVDSRSASQRHLWESAELMRGLAAMAAVAVVKVRYFEASVEQARVAARLAERERVARELSEKNAQLEALNQQLQSAVVTDPLTQLFNRRHLTALIQRAHEDPEGRTRSGSYGVIICDIDHFKTINDTWGHPAGDRVLVETSLRLQAAVRADDRVFRYGGEEMVVLTKTTDPELLGALGERLRRAMSDQPFVVDEGTEVTITVSVGCATFDAQRDGEWSSVLQRADVALYAAKTGGRNRVVIAERHDQDCSEVA
jgi:diguanylate cyclase (GGDEF)-like protein